MYKHAKSTAKPLANSIKHRTKIVAFAILIFFLTALMQTQSPSLATDLTLPNKLGSDLELLETRDGDFIAISKKEGSADILRLKSGSESFETLGTANFNVRACACSADKLCLTQAILDTGRDPYFFTELHTHSLESPETPTITTFAGSVSSSTQMAIGGNLLFFLDTTWGANNKISVENLCGETPLSNKNLSEIDNLKVSGTEKFLTLQTDQSGNVLAITSENNLWKIDTKTLNFEIFSGATTGIQAIGDELFLLPNGDVVKVSSQSLTKIKSLPMVDGVGCAAFGGILVKSGNKTLSLFDLEGSELQKAVTLSKNIVGLCTSGGTTIVVIGDSNGNYIKEIFSSDLVSTAGQGETPDPSDPDDEYEITEPGGNEPSETGNEIFDKIFSSAYILDRFKRRISGIEIGTTLAELKKNIEFSGYTLSCLNYLGKVLTSGKLGTGATLTFTPENGEPIAFTIVVRADLTGEGSMNTRDRTAFYDHLFETKLLEGIFGEAADLNGDGVVDTLDLLTFQQMLES